MERMHRFGAECRGDTHPRRTQSACTTLGPVHRGQGSCQSPSAHEAGHVAEKG